MYPLKSQNVPLGVHVPQFGNPCYRKIKMVLLLWPTNYVLSLSLAIWMLILFYSFSASSCERLFAVVGVVNCFEVL